MNAVVLVPTPKSPTDAEAPKTLWFVGHKHIPAGVLYGIFSTEAKAKEAIQTHASKRADSFYIDEITLDHWHKYGVDL